MSVHYLVETLLEGRRELTLHFAAGLLIVHVMIGLLLTVAVVVVVVVLDENGRFGRLQVVVVGDVDAVRATFALRLLDHHARLLRN